MIETLRQVHSAVRRTAGQGVERIVDAREWERVAFCNSINFPIINAHTPGTILLFDDDDGRRPRRVGVSDDADLDEFARLLGDFVSFLSVRYPLRMLADGSRVADVDLVVNAVCEAEVVVSC